MSKPAISGTSWQQSSLLLSVVLAFGCICVCYSQADHPRLWFAPVDYFEQSDLPIGLEAATLVKEAEKSRVKARISNRTDEIINGVAFTLVSFDASGKIVDRQTWLEKLDLDSGELRPVTLRLNHNVPFEKDGKLVLGIEEVFGSRSIWLSEKVHNAIELYGAGKVWQAPVVKRVSNAVDSPTGSQ